MSALTLAELRDWLDRAPDGTMLGAAALRSMLSDSAPAKSREAPEPAAGEATWRERIWTVPAETRLSVAEVAEGIGRPRSWVYRHTSEKSAGSDRLPCRKLDGELVFVAGEIRTWIADHEEVVTPGRVSRAPLSIAPRKVS